jgi:hypothetical protein
MFSLTISERMCCTWVTCLVSILLSGDRDYLRIFGLSRLLPEDGDRVKSLKCCFSIKNKMMDNAQKSIIVLHH